MGLQQFERRIERLVEGVFARAFRSGLQPVEIGRRLTREMDLQRTMAPRGTLTANEFVVVLSAADADRFAPIEAELVHELVSVARDHAYRENYTFVGPVNVEIEVDDHLVQGTLEVEARMSASAVGASVVLSDGRRVPITESGLTIGRLPECEVTVSDRNVSRRHAQIRSAEGRYAVVDLGSTNGTSVNGTTISGPHELQTGDEITMGSTVLRFELA
jgi:Protein of unknown function (DUF3662)/FHA domain